MPDPDQNQPAPDESPLEQNPQRPGQPQDASQPPQPQEQEQEQTALDQRT